MGAAALGLVLALAACAPAGQLRSETPQASPRLPPSSSCGRVHGAAETPVPLDAAGTGSSVALAREGEQTLAYVADADTQAIHVVDVDSGTWRGSTPLDGRPEQIVFTPDGRLIVALRDLGRVAVLEPAPHQAAVLEPRCSASTAAEPLGLALGPNGRRVLVASGWGATLAAYDISTLERRFEVGLARSPRSVAVSRDGKRAYVAHAVGGIVSTVRLDDAHGVDEIPLHERRPYVEARLEAQLRMRLGEDASEQQMRDMREQSLGARGERRALQGFALAKSVRSDGRIFAPQVHVDPGQPEQRTPGYGHERVDTHRPSIAVIDAAAGRALGASLAPPPSQARLRAEARAERCLLPRAAVVDPETRSLLVACMGMGSVIAYDALSASPVLTERHRWRVAAGPTGIALDTATRRAVVWSQLDRELSVVPISGPLPAIDAEPSAPERIALADDPEREPPVMIKLGRLLFHSTDDARIASDGRACASCHPGGRDDGLVWSTPNGPRRTKMLAGRLRDTEPYGWDGAAQTLRSHLHSTFDRLGGVGGLRSLELDALIAYLRWLSPPPQGAEQADSELVRKGRRLFASSETECARCHAGVVRTDGRPHDLGSSVPADRTGRFDTPSLRFVSGRAPFFHDGRFASLGELLRDGEAKMGRTDHLSPDELDALEAYLRTL